MKFKKTLFLIIILILTKNLFSQSSSNKIEVLYINSYDYNMNWAKEIYSGLNDVLQKNNDIKLHYEALDSKEFYSETNFYNFYNYLKNKYSGYKFNLIFCSDNNAFDLLKKHHKELYPGVPIVFCGVNDFSLDMIKGHKEFTGISEVSSVKETVDLALRLHPNTKELFIINDYLVTGKAWRRQFEKELADYKNLRVTYSENQSIRELTERISNLPSDTLILLGVYYSDKNNISSSYEEMAKILGESSNNPFYTLVKFNIQSGIIGGKVISGYIHGKSIGEMGLEILNGKKPEEIPVGNTEYNKFIFNYNELKRFNINFKYLPKDSQIINKPYSVYEEYKLIIWLIIILILILSLSVILLVINFSKKREAEKTLRQFSDATWEGILIHNNENILQMNNRFTEIFGYTTEDLVGSKYLEKIIAPEYLEKTYKIISENILDVYEIVGIKKSGLRVPVEIRIKRINFNRQPARVAVIRDLSDQKKAEKEYNYLLSLWDNMFENSIEAIFVFNSDQIIERVNKSFVSITGYESEEALGQHISLFKSEYQTETLDNDILNSVNINGRWSGELLTRRKSGELFSMLLTISSFSGSSITDKKLIGVFRDISDKKQQEEELKWMSRNDVLTGFSNRSYFLDILKSELKVSSRSDELCGIVLLNIDGLKNINNSYGFITGDKIIREFSNKLKNCLRDEDIVSRFSGDEFAVLAPRFKDKNQINSLIKRVRKSIKHTINIDDEIFDLSVSIGVSIFPFDGVGENDLLSKAGTALKRTKTNKKGSCSFYNPELDKAEIMNLELELELKKALILNEMEVYYQPKVDPFNNETMGFEGLIRWNKRKQEWIPPSAFIPISEENGQIIEIGYFVINQACDFITTLLDRGFKRFNVGVNVSAKQFGDPKFIDDLINIVEGNGIDPKYMDLEITESVTVSKIFNTIESLTRLRNYGFSISIDDFGTGYSSLKYLMTLPFDTMKIDKSFVDTILIEEEDHTILNIMISLAHALNKKIVAEGVETKEQADYLINGNCQLIQGYYYYKPMPKDEILNLIENKKLKIK